MLSHIVHSVFTLLHESSWKRIVLTVLIAGTLFWGYQLKNLKFSYDIENFFDPNDPQVQLYEEFKKTFGNENDALLIGIRSQQGIFNTDFLSKIDLLTQALDTISNVARVISPTNLREYVKGPMGHFTPIPVVHLGNQEKLARDSVRVHKNKNYVGSFFSANHPSISILLYLEHGLNRKENKVLLRRINELITNRNLNIEEYHLAGRIQTQHYYISTMKKEMGLFAGLGLLLFCVSIYVIFRQAKFVLIPLTVVSISVVWIFGIISLIGYSIDLMITILPTLIFILSTSVAIHLLSRFNSYRASESNTTYAIKQAFVETSIPNLLISITTAVGFGAMYFLPVRSIQYFGIFTAIGIIITFIINSIMIPSMLQLFKVEHKEVRKFEWNTPITRINQLIEYKSHWIAAVFISIGIIAMGAGFSQLKINNYFLDDLDNESQAKQDLLFFDKEFSGIRTFEAVVTTTSGNEVMSHENMLFIDSLELFLKDNYDLGMIYSPVTLIKTLNKSLHGGSQKYYKIPKDESTYNQLIKRLKKPNMGKYLKMVVDQNTEKARISGRVPDQGRLVYHRKNKTLKTFVETLAPQITVRLSGVSHLIDRANAKVTTSFLYGLGLVMVVLIIVITSQTRSFQLTFIAVFVNCLPLLFVGAIMGMLDIHMKISTAMIFTIILGISVDDTIHFMHCYMENRREDASQAISKAVSQMIYPILFTSIILFAGFMIFSLSSFESIRVLGWMTSLSLFVAMLADLILMPALIHITNRLFIKEYKTAISSVS